MVASDGWIVTNRHVIDGATEVDVRFTDGRSQPGSVAAVDNLVDLALVRVEASGLPAVTLGQSGSLQVGQRVVAIGNSKGFLSNT
ncbi:MAG TPA: trypsin-like peptidase domain-containing protein, partial [Candidatus Limnocylindrales bacterium]